MLVAAQTSLQITKSFVSNLLIRQNEAKRRRNGPATLWLLGAKPFHTFRHLCCKQTKAKVCCVKMLYTLGNWGGGGQKVFALTEKLKSF